MKIIRRLDASRLILIYALVVKNALARDPTAHSWMVVPGTRSKWYPPTIGKPRTGLRCRIFRLLHPLLKRLVLVYRLRVGIYAALDGVRSQSRLFAYTLRVCRVLGKSFHGRQVFRFTD